jgi:hypothetical protein
LKKPSKKLAGLGVKVSGVLDDMEASLLQSLNGRSSAAEVKFNGR